MKFQKGNTLGKLGGRPKGIPFSEEHRRKLSESHKGMSTWQGRKHSEESKIKMRETKARNREPDYELKSSVNHLLRTSSEYRNWQKQVFSRDLFTCVFCKTKGGWNKELKKRIEIDADHISSWCDFPELRFDVSNGRTLCKPCHRKTDSYGRKKLRFDIDLSLCV
jgi:hypothetical protein